MVGLRGAVEREVTAEVVEAYCALTGDSDPLHVDPVFAAASSYGERIAPGALLIAYMMAAAVEVTGALDVAVPSLGFDRLRHTAAVRIGDVVRVEYEVVSFDGARGHADVTVRNQAGEVVAVADHVFRVLA